MTRRRNKSGKFLFLIFLAVVTAAAVVLLLPPCESLRIAILERQFYRLGSGNLDVAGFTTNIHSRIALQNVRWTNGEYELTVKKCGIVFRLNDLF